MDLGMYRNQLTILSLNVNGVGFLGHLSVLNFSSK